MPARIPGSMLQIISLIYVEFNIPKVRIWKIVIDQVTHSNRLILSMGSHGADIMALKFVQAGLKPLHVALRAALFLEQPLRSKQSVNLCIFQWVGILSRSGVHATPCQSNNRNENRPSLSSALHPVELSGRRNLCSHCISLQNPTGSISPLASGQNGQPKRRNSTHLRPRPLTPYRQPHGMSPPSITPHISQPPYILNQFPP